MRPPLITLFFLFISTIGFSQYEMFSEIPDSLKNRSYEELTESYYRHNAKFKELPVYANAHIIKGQKEKNQRQAVIGMIRLYRFIDLDLKKKYADSIIFYGKLLNKKVFELTGYVFKGDNARDEHIYGEAFEYYLKAKKYAELEKDSFNLFNLKNTIGLLKSKLGDYEESLSLFKEYHLYMKKESQKDKYFIDPYIRSLMVLSDSYLKNRSLDSSYYYAKYGIEQCLKYNKNDLYYHLLQTIGITEYVRGEYNNAIDSLKKASEYLIENDSRIQLIINFSYTGKSYQKKGEFKKAVFFMEKMDSLMQMTSFADMGTRKAYEFLIDYYKSNGNRDKQLEYTQKLLNIDVYLFNNQTVLIREINEKYDTPNLIAEKEELIYGLKKNEKRSNISLTISLILLMLFSGLIYYYSKRNRIYRDRFKKLMLENKKSISKKVFPNKINGISDDLVSKIRNDLNEFINKKEFRNNSITLNSLAKKLQTNSNYLSKVINHYEQKNFSTYINDLRVDYSVQQLKNDNKFGMYSIKGIAQEIGFNSAESFSKAFHKKTGIYPSYFIKQLDKHKLPELIIQHK